MLETMLNDTIFCNKELCKYNMELEREKIILKEALKLACKKFIRDEVGMLTDTELYDYFIEQAKESMK